MTTRLLLWLALGLTLMQALFFIAAGILPLETVGPPAFDRIVLRQRMWGASGQPMLFVATAAAALLTVFTGAKSGKLGEVASALGLLLAAHIVLLSEGPILIRHGELVMAVAQANWGILATRVFSAGSAVVSFLLMARMVLHQLEREA